MTFTVENLEFYILILVRISTFIFVAPIFSLNNVPVKMKAGLCLFMTLVFAPMIPYYDLAYVGVIGYAGLVLKEAIVGLLIGFGAGICTTIINFAGHLIDMEIGLSMVNVLDPVSKVQSTITGNIYSYFVMLIMLITNLHHYLINAIFDTYKLIPIGGANLQPSLYVGMVKFISDYFVIGFRIVLPIFAGILIVNVVLAILAKVAPQMNMFVIGMQLKIFVGLFILLLVINYIPAVTDFIVIEMKDMMKFFIKGLT